VPQLILADKSELFRRTLSSVLQRDGYEVVQAETGQRVLTLATQLRPFAIIMDIEVESPSGIETLLLLKREPALRRLPIILVSRESVRSSVGSALKVGVESFLLKPVDLNVLTRTLKGLQVPLPQVGAPVSLFFGETQSVAQVRFIDQYGTVYLDRGECDESVMDDQVRKMLSVEEQSLLYNEVAPVGSYGVITFPTNGAMEASQTVLLQEENAQGIAVFPVGDPVVGGEPDVLRVPVNYKCRFMVSGGFMKLANVVSLHGKGLLLSGITEEPRFNSLVDITLYPGEFGANGGIPLKGRLTGYRMMSAQTYEANVEFVSPLGLGFVNLIAELIAGRPVRS
jgi:CheY-like chemotaxis protein